MPLPLLGTDQGALPFDGFAPFVRSRALQHWRNADGGLAPLTRQTATLTPRSGTAAVFDSNGAAVTVPAIVPAWCAVDWSGGGTRDELVLQLNDEEMLIFSDVDAGALYWPVMAVTVLHEFVFTANGPLWSHTNDGATGAYLKLEATAGAVVFTHHNGTSAVTSTAGSGLVAGDRASVVATMATSGAVQARLIKNGGAESVGGASDAHTPAAVWGGGAGVVARINGFGSAVFGEQSVRTSAVFPGVATRAAVLGAL
jgi:hypothetical protein